MSASSATVTVAGDVPNSRTLVKTNVSETEMVTGTPGTFTVKTPLNRVSNARINQPEDGGAWYN